VFRARVGAVVGAAVRVKEWAVVGAVGILDVGTSRLVAALVQPHGPVYIVRVT
jgi:hypothetical protein